MSRNRNAASPPLYGMAMVFVALAILAITTELHPCRWSFIGYGAAAGFAVVGLALAFRDFS